MTWSSQKPSSRRRLWTSGVAQSCLIRTATPALTRLRGQTLHRVSSLRPAPTAFVQFIFEVKHVRCDRVSPPIFCHFIDIICTGLDAGALTGVKAYDQIRGVDFREWARPLSINTWTFKPG
jgi:hypothetical protein